MAKDTLSDFFKQSQYHMADIGKKQSTFRRAVAMGRIYVGEEAFTHIKEHTLPKGDVLKLAEIAGVQGAKMAWQQIPMCHPLLLDHAVICPQLEAETSSVAVYASVATVAKTGVEMEALAAVNAALLTLYDLTKPVEPALMISDVRLLMKEGGKKGFWVHPDGLPEALSGLGPSQVHPLLKGYKAAVLTMSDRAHKGVYADKSGEILKEALINLQCDSVEKIILPDDAEGLKQKITELSAQVDLILTTGGTGIAPRDITPQSISELSLYEVPGIGELLRSYARDTVPTTWLSRSVAGVVNETLVIALPGSTGGVRDGVAALSPLLGHLLDHLTDKDEVQGHPSEPAV